MWPLSSTISTHTETEADTANKTADTNPQPTPASKPELDGAHRDLPIHGRFDKYRSSYWAGAMAALGLRYFGKLFTQKLFDNKEISYSNRHSYSLAAGGIMGTTTGYYAFQTYKDIKSIFAEAVAWEQDKDEKDIGLMDMWTSNNTVVQQTLSNFVKYNIRRFAVNATFFLPFIPGAKKYIQKWGYDHGEVGVNFGVAMTAGYLFSDIMTRQITPFEELQSLIDRKINHEEHFADKFIATDLLDIYERHSEYDHSRSFMRNRGSDKWDETMALFDRMADLMNQTYRNVVSREQVEFGFSRFVYLIGHHLIDPDKLDQSRAYVEIAAKYDPTALKDVQAQLAKGVKLEEILERYPAAKTYEARDVKIDEYEPQPTSFEILKGETAVPLSASDYQAPEKQKYFTKDITPKGEDHKKNMDKKQSFAATEDSYRQKNTLDTSAMTL